MKLLSGITICLIAMAGSAMAADMALKAPPPAAAPWSWTGFYVGGNVGYGWGNDPTNFTYTSTVTTVTTPGSHGIGPPPPTTTTVTTTTDNGSTAGNMNGWFGGVQAGYNWQRDRWLLGLETDFHWTAQRDDPTFCATSGCPAGALFATNATNLPWFGTVRGRVGVTSDPSSMWGPLLLYVTGGLAYGRIEETYTGGLVGGPIGITSVDTTRAGWTIGGGTEARLGNSNWTLKLEYLFMDFGSVSGAASSVVGPVTTPIIVNGVSFGSTTTTTAITGTASTHVTDNVVRLGLNYKFSLQ